MVCDGLVGVIMGCHNGVGSDGVQVLYGYLQEGTHRLSQGLCQLVSFTKKKQPAWPGRAGRQQEELALSKIGRKEAAWWAQHW